MNELFAKCCAWLADRTAPARLETEKPVPAGVSWARALGAATILVLVVEAVTGWLLMLDYTPVIGGAWESILHIENRVLFGRLVRSLHHYGASALVVLVFLHLLRVYLHAAYKPPRELVWLTGIALLGLVLAFGFTGALLPWDQEAYWGTRVRLGYLGSVPVAGPLLQQVVTGGTEVGQATLTRFYSLHVALLPLLLLLLTAHLALVRRKGLTPPGIPVGQEPAAAAIAPVQRLRNWALGALVVGILFALAAARPAQLELLADPSGTVDPTYEPVAEWYFLFLFQLVKDLGSAAPWLPQWVPSILLPTLAIAFLALLPWLDRSPERRARRRPFFTGALCLSLLAMGALTARAVAHLPDNKELAEVAFGQITENGKRLRDPAFQQLAAEGLQVMEGLRLKCAACHQFRGQGGNTGPPLDASAMRYNRAWLAQKIRDPQSLMEPGQQTRMPAYGRDQLSDAQLDALLAALCQREPVLQLRGP